MSDLLLTTAPANSVATGGEFTSPAIRHAISRLALALQLARDVNRDCWDFAVEYSDLRALSLNVTECRWLICKGYVRHAREVTSVTSVARQFESEGELLTERSCLVLTEQGEHFAAHLAHIASGDMALRHVIELKEPAPRVESPVGGAQQRLPGAPRPVFDRQRRELRYNGKVVKRFRLPAANQEAILFAFEEENWPARIDDPLPGVAGATPKQRLHDTIKSLNAKQQHCLLRFSGDGTGEGVLWEPILCDDELSQNS